jgi:hypothetical protein
MKGCRTVAKVPQRVVQVPKHQAMTHCVGFFSAKGC